MQLDVQRTNAPSFPTSSPLEGPGLPHAQSRSCEVCQTPSPLPRPVLSSELSPQTVHPPRRLHHHLVRDLLTWVCVSHCRTWTPAPFPPMPSDLGIECSGPSLAPLLRTFPGVSGPLAPLSGSPPLLPVFASKHLFPHSPSFQPQDIHTCCPAPLFLPLCPGSHLQGSHVAPQ